MLRSSGVCFPLDDASSAETLYVSPVRGAGEEIQ